MRAWTPEDIDGLGLVTDVVTAGSIFKLSRSQSYELARRGEFPVPVMQLGCRYRVVVAHIRDALGLGPPDRNPPDPRPTPRLTGL